MRAAAYKTFISSSRPPMPSLGVCGHYTCVVSLTYIILTKYSLKSKFKIRFFFLAQDKENSMGWHSKCPDRDYQSPAPPGEWGRLSCPELVIHSELCNCFQSFFMMLCDRFSKGYTGLCHHCPGVESWRKMPKVLCLLNRSPHAPLLVFLCNFITLSLSLLLTCVSFPQRSTSPSSLASCRSRLAMMCWLKTPSPPCSTITGNSWKSTSLQQRLTRSSAWCERTGSPGEVPERRRCLHI